MFPDEAPLLDIVLAIDKAVGFIQGLDAASFHADDRTRWAVYSQIIIIGEAANRLSRDIQQRHPEVPWGDIIGMRHRLVHGYDRVKWDRVWDTVVNDLPRLKASVGPLIPEEP